MGYNPAELNNLGSTDLLRNIHARLLKQKPKGNIESKHNLHIKVGSFVFLLHDRDKFFKSFDLGSTAIYQVRRIDKQKEPWRYYLNDLKNDPVNQGVYGSQLILSPNPAKVKFPISHIVETEYVNKKKTASL